VLAALGVFSAGLVLVAAAFSRNLAALSRLQSSIPPADLAEQALLHESLKRSYKDLVIPTEPLPGYSASLTMQKVKLSRDPLSELEIERVTGAVTWEHRGQSRTTQFVTGIPPQKEEEAAPAS